jgi:DNA-binding response OmpR family regulator
MKKILIVEDDKAILKGLTDNLSAEHFEVVAATDGQRGYELAKARKLDVILLDLMLPLLNGNEVCKKLRSEGITTPIIMLTSKNTEMDKVMGLELGADDYVTKPFSVRELIARINAVLRRQSAIVAKLEECTFDDVYVDFKKQEARKGKKKIEMTAKEFELLRYFVEREGEVITRARLLDDVWGYEATPTTRTVDNYILGLRKKIETHPSKPAHLITVHTSGYKFAR